MKYRNLGNSNLQVSQIGLGCMSIGTEEQHALSIIDEALELGINYFDTADLYDFGLNEEYVGKAIKHKRSNIILATKVGNRRIPGEEGWVWDPRKQYIKEAVKQSLQRLQTDYVDLYQLHGGTIDDPIDEIIEAFEELKQEGVIRYYGISSIRPNVIKEYIKKSSIISVMMQYSILDRRPEEEIMSILEDNQISLIARGPVAKGILTSSNSQSNGYIHLTPEEIKTALEKIKEHFPDRSVNEIALQYCLFPRAVGAIIPGASKKDQLIDNVRAALSNPLSEDDIHFIQNLVRADIYHDHR
ncbi:aldo/keto reductase [Bacillus salitolerans]|uniref:Aldo/keto reductase n=1 Tax=Bacillus salitolerans TaxID=1437434 RepID=A0ABW4LW76_9BACI